MRVESNAWLGARNLLSLPKTLSGGIILEQQNQRMLESDDCDSQAADWGAARLFYVAPTTSSGSACSSPSNQHPTPAGANPGKANCLRSRDLCLALSAFR